MKEKPPSKARRAEWEKFLKENQQLPIYMGDHMTRTWSKTERGASIEGDTETTNNNTHSIKAQASTPRPCAHSDSNASKIVPSNRSQYSIRKINGKRKRKSCKEILMHHPITKEDMLEWQESFDSLLSSPAGRYVFKVFLESEIADENLKFWLACEDLKQSKDKKLDKRIQEIYDTYISVFSPQEINIDYKMREDIVDQLKLKMDVSVFKQAQHQVYTLMHRDSYPRFLSSAFKEELMKALSERRNTETKPRRTSREESSSKSTSGLISCCYCRRNNSEQDITTLVEEQRDTSTSVGNKSTEVPPPLDFPPRHSAPDSTPVTSLQPSSAKPDSELPNSNISPVQDHAISPESTVKPDSKRLDVKEPDQERSSPTVINPQQNTPTAIEGEAVNG